MSLRIHNVPAGTCTYACAHCPLAGRADHTRDDGARDDRVRDDRCKFCDPDEIAHSVAARLDELRALGEHVDCLAFAGAGEPTLDLALGDAILKLRPLGVKIAVATNGSLLWRHDVRSELHAAHNVAVKLDAATPGVWRKLHEPTPALHFEDVMEGIWSFARGYRGELVTVTTLVDDANVSADELLQLAEVTAGLEPRVAYLRPATRALGEQVIETAQELFSQRVPNLRWL